MKNLFKSTLVPFVIATVLVVAAVVPAFAASVTKSVSGNNTYVYATTKKWKAFSKPATNFTFKNVGKGQVAIYTYTKTSAWGWTGPVYEATLSPNQSRSKTIKANATEVKFFLQPAGGSNPKKITVTTDGTSLR